MPRQARVWDDFTGRSSYWRWRIDGIAGFNIRGSILEMWMGPTEALYYSNAEIADGEYEELPWLEGRVRVRARLTREHYGSAGFGFWNHSMRIGESFPAWFIYLKAYGKYPLQGLFAQLGDTFQPIKLYKPLTSYALVLKLLPIAPIRIASPKPSMQSLNLHQWNTYEVEWKANRATFRINGVTVAELKTRMKPAKTCRVDIWIDNAVYQPHRRDPGKVYRHATQENRVKTVLEVDWIEITGIQP